MNTECWNNNLFKPGWVCRMTIDPLVDLLATFEIMLPLFWRVDDWLETGAVVKIIVAGICWLFDDDEAGEFADFVTNVVIGKFGIFFVAAWICEIGVLEDWIVDVVWWVSLLTSDWLP